ncbi:MAG: hypothetical protein K2W82_08085 [Candidatus Obscuribacterales bacterium]|nr:hypothetical protein [Candidatus Obscuribacterales bacterium]
MPDVMSEDEFTQRFRERLAGLPIVFNNASPLTLDLSYGENEPVLKLSLQDAYNRYHANPADLDNILEPFIQDLTWTAQEPRYGAQVVYENVVPVLRNFVANPPSPDELGSGSDCPKGPIVYTEILRSEHEYLVAQFMLHKDGKNTPLRKGDVLSCLPDAETLTQISFRNISAIIEKDGISAFPLKFESLQIQAWLVGLNFEENKELISSLICIPQAILSLEETLEAKDGLIAVIPSNDQMIISNAVDEESMCALGLLAKQVSERIASPLSSLLWKFKGGNLEGVQALELAEENP